MLHEWFDQVEAILPETFKPGFRQLAESHDYQFDLNFERSPMELMPPQEIEEFIEDFNHQFSLEQLHGACALWQSDNRDMAVLYLEGPLFGQVSMRDHLYTMNPVPVAYRSIPSFRESMEEAARQNLDWYEIPTDYYISTDYYSSESASCKPASKQDIEFDREVVRQLRKEYAATETFDEHNAPYFSQNIIGITPPEDTADILEFLNTEKMYVPTRMYVQEYACSVLGFRKYAPAIERLGEVALTAKGNGKTAAVRALGQIGTADACDRILKSVPTFSRGLGMLLASSLERCGCNTEKRDREYYYQLPNSEEWHKIEAGK